MNISYTIIPTYKYISAYVNKNKSNILVILITVMICLMLYIHYKRNTVKEGIVNEINKAIGEVRNVSSKLNRIPGEIKSVTDGVSRIPRQVERGVTKVVDDTKREVNKVGDQVNKGVQKIENEGKRVTGKVQSELNNFMRRVKSTVNNIVQKKLIGFFKNLADELDNAFGKPMATLFLGIGRVFELLGEIIMMIIDKIVALPDCVPYYSLGAGKGMTKEFLPGWIYDIITFFHKVCMFWLNLFKPILKLFGIDIDAWQDEINRKCYKFDTKSKTDEMTRVMNNAGKSFTKNFGKIDFKRLVR